MSSNEKLETTITKDSISGRKEIRIEITGYGEHEALFNRVRDAVNEAIENGGDGA